MPSSIGTLLAVAALTGMSAGAVPPCPSPGDSITVALCGEHGTMTIPLGRPPTDQRRECQGGCHAICHRKDFCDDEE